MDYSLDFKPRFVLGINNTTYVYFNFYDYDKHKDIKCYEENGTTPVLDETVEYVLNKYYSGNDKELVYYVKYRESKFTNSKVFECVAQDPNGLLYFIGYSEFSALHAIEDCENARKLILGRYWKPDKKESDSNKDK